MSIEAMKQALKFCEEIGDLRGPYPFVNETSIVSDSRKVLRALRQAIAEAEKQEPVAWIVDGEIKVRLDMAGKLYCSETNVYGKDVVNKAIEQEPVAIGEEWKPCVKLPIIVHVREQRKGETHVSTREGITPVKEDDLIMRGVAGEEYPIGRELFNRTYTFDTAPLHAIDMLEKHVHKSDKDQLVPDGTIPISNGGIATSTPTDFFAPPKREWVGLTDDEFQACFDHADGTLGSLMYAIEAKLKEKNGG